MLQGVHAGIRVCSSYCSVGFGHQRVTHRASSAFTVRKQRWLLALSWALSSVLGYLHSGSIRCIQNVGFPVVSVFFRGWGSDAMAVWGGLSISESQSWAVWVLQGVLLLFWKGEGGTANLCVPGKALQIEYCWALWMCSAVLYLALRRHCPAVHHFLMPGDVDH